MKINARDEFLNNIVNDSVIASKINGRILKVGYTQEDYQVFLNSLDFNYDDGYGCQFLVGTIWCENGVWFDRGEYDGSEWWNRNEYPAIPDELK